MIFFYSLALLPVLTWLILWVRDHGIVLWEGVAGSVLALLMAVGFHWMAIQAQCRDHEVFSGKMVSATHHPYWQSRVQVDDYEDREEEYTDSDGNTQTRTVRVKVGWHYEYDDHPEHWDCEAEFGPYVGSSTHAISQKFYEEIAKNFCNGKPDIERPGKPDFYKGDRNEYVARNRNDYWYPMTRWVAFENRIKASPSLYSYAPVPEDVPVFPYPTLRDPFNSDRLLGTASSTINGREFDIFCSKLGPIKKVNVVMVGFGDVDPMLAQYQEAAWVGGKKNDLVLCYGGKDPLHPTWSRVFGWTDSTLAKANLETILIKNPVDVTILPLLHAEIFKNYEIKEWRDFSYLQVEPPPWSYWVYVICMILAQSGFWCWARSNGHSKI